jgi:hypothetical protein
MMGQKHSQAINKYLELQIQSLQNVPTVADKLKALLKSKQRQKEEQAMHIEDTQRLVTEIKMLIVIMYCIWCRGEEAEVAKARRDLNSCFEAYYYFLSI